MNFFRFVKLFVIRHYIIEDDWVHVVPSFNMLNSEGFRTDFHLKDKEYLHCYQVVKVKPQSPKSTYDRIRLYLPSFNFKSVLTECLSLNRSSAQEAMI